MLVISYSCEQKSKSELLLGEWEIDSWITKNKYTNNKEKEMVNDQDFSISVKFEKDSLKIIEKNKIETYEYYLSGDSIILPRDVLGGIYLVKEIKNAEIHLFEHKKFNMQDGEVLESSSRIKLIKKER